LLAGGALIAVNTSCAIGAVLAGSAVKTGSACASGSAWVSLARDQTGEANHHDKQKG
jgi:hypothetical protein